MHKNIFILISLVCALFAQAQDISQKDYLITATLYDAAFNSIDGDAETKIAAYIKAKTLSELVAADIISRENMAGFALPLGVFKNEAPVDFYNGMFAMWEAKTLQMQKKSPKIDVNIMATALQALAAMRNPGKKMTLLQYRSTMLMAAADSLTALHRQMQALYSADRKVFMDLIAENLSANILLAYNIQEMMPPTHLLENGNIKDINPLFKAYYLDRLLQEAGCEFICFFPARYDALHSFGPFQFTNIALADIMENTRLVKGFKVFPSMSALKKTEDHALAAAFFAYDNWERLSYILNSGGLLDKFNNYFADCNTNADKKRQLRLLIAGITACMHHQPPQTFNIVKDYLKKNTSLTSIHYEMMTSLGNKQLQKYYRSAAEAYLMLKVYDKLMDE